MTQETLSELELKYHKIAELYDLAEAMVATVEGADVIDPKAQLEVVEPLVEQIGESADVLCEEFIEVAGKKQNGATRRMKIEGALRRIYIAMDAYADRAKAMSSNYGEGVRNVADAIVEKIKLQVEIIISVLVDYVDLALERIMNKKHMQELKERQEKISLMLYAAERRSAFERGA
ncbi:MAG: hypothetical protein EAZ74_00320 [Alphaproteobacteria bacterium]|nr:MAG: hypothetical protein EAY76_02790 [Alphaproteobacteria bacterium]TAF15995.1 MAG: hypothetical protein EAZ74_00320 [Alphaproteobacteria bacterium]TAF39255.1 MAG: hypothetical protein EAZ66_05065 [Alphaproteobacteria bacterium]TAF76233.1 MAG: hypothetical protein EAZ52_04870 [Alphaproteobacteria bacterium]